MTESSMFTVSDVQCSKSLHYSFYFSHRATLQIPLMPTLADVVEFGHPILAILPGLQIQQLHPAMPAIHMLKHPPGLHLSPLSTLLMLHHISQVLRQSLHTPPGQFQTEHLLLALFVRLPSANVENSLNSHKADQPYQMKNAPLSVLPKAYSPL